MFVAIPVSTDAPVYHYPYATMGLIGVNFAIFVASGFLPENVFESLMLNCGQRTINPLQWVSTLFLHADIFHLFGNLVFLWTFGLVTEGKLGSLWFLLCYMGIGMTGAMVEQLMLMGSEDIVYVLGASGAIYGLMAMSLVWAPQNEVKLVGFYILIIMIRFFSWDVTILGMATFYIFLDVFFAWLQGFQLSTQLIHSLGAGLGMSIGLLLLKYDLVDCENWDVFSVWAGHPGKSAEEVAAQPKSRRSEYVPPPELAHLGKAPLAEDDPDDSGGKVSPKKIRAKLSQCIAEEKSVAALVQYNKLLMLGRPVTFAEPELLKLIELLHRDNLWEEGIPFLERYLREFTSKEIPIRLRLAKIYIERQQRPQQGLKLLDSLPEDLGDKLNGNRDRLRAKARQLINEGVIELDGHEW